jgi:hypothetical protein
MDGDALKEMVEQLDRTETSVMVAVENGLFLDTPGKIALAEIVALSDGARAAAKTGAEQIVNIAALKIQAILSTEVHRPDRLGWRLVYVYGLPNFVGGTLAYVVVCWILAQYGGEASSVTYRALFWGATGGYVQGMYFTVQNLFTERLRQAWISWAPITPLIGAFLGLFLLQAGLAGAGFLNLKPTVSEDSVEYLEATVAAFAGFRWKWAIEKISGAINSLVGK